MRSVIWMILLFAGAVVAAAALNQNDGLVSVFWSGYRLDTSLNVFVISLLLFVIVLYLALKAINGLLGMPRRAHEWRELKRERAAHAALRDAHAEYLAARFNRSHKAARQALALQDDVAVLRGDREFAGLAHLIAAASLHRIQDRRGRDERARQVVELTSGGLSGSVVLDGAHLLMAEWALDDRDAERGLEALRALPPGVARRTQALRLKLQAARMAHKPIEALQTARLLAKHQGFSQIAAQSLLRSLAIDVVCAAHDEEQLLRAWQSLDASDRRDVIVGSRAAVRARELGRPDLGRDYLMPHWSELARMDADERGVLALALIDCIAGIGNEWLPRVEAALVAHGNEPAIVAAAAMLFAERQLWGKARRPLERSSTTAILPAGVRRHALRRLAFIARLEGDEDRGGQYERQASAID
jgi:HemY protein